MVFPLGAVLGAIGTVAGSALSTHSARGQAQATRRQALADRRHAEKLDRTRIQRLVKDANKAGISPLAAMGAAGGSYGFATPTSAFGGAPISGSALGDAIGEIGRGIDNADAKSLQIENAKLQNEALRADIAYRKAGTAQLLANATSRTVIGNANSQPKAVTIVGQSLTRDPSFSSEAQTLENEFGEFAGDAGGAASLMRSAAPRFKEVLDYYSPQNLSAWGMEALMRRVFGTSPGRAPVPRGR